MSGEAFGLDRRVVPRVKLSTKARLSPNDWSSVDVDVIDISSHGFRAACELLMRPGARVAIDIPGIGSVQSYLVWCDRYEFGAKFAEPIVLSNCIALAEQGQCPVDDRRRGPKVEQETAAAPVEAGRPCDWHLQKIGTEPFLGMTGIEPLSELWSEGELIGYVWPFGGAWCADFEPNLRPIVECGSSLEAVRALLEKRPQGRART